MCDPYKVGRGKGSLSAGVAPDYCCQPFRLFAPAAAIAHGANVCRQFLRLKAISKILIIKMTRKSKMPKAKKRAKAMI